MCLNARLLLSLHTSQLQVCSIKGGCRSHCTPANCNYTFNNERGLLSLHTSQLQASMFNKGRVSLSLHTRQSAPLTTVPKVVSHTHTHTHTHTHRVDTGTSLCPSPLYRLPTVLTQTRSCTLRCNSRSQPCTLTWRVAKDIVDVHCPLFQNR